jgi:hypothetical protein
MEVLFEVIEYCLDLGSASQQFSLDFSHDLPSLFVVRWSEDECSKSLSYFAVEGCASVVRVANGDSDMFVA